MIYEHPDFDHDEAAERQDRKDNNGLVCHCGHSQFFWDKVPIVNFGDIIACEACSQYFVKASGKPWIIKRRKSSEHAAMGIDYEFPTHTHHLNTLVLTPVDIRIN